MSCVPIKRLAINMFTEDQIRIKATEAPRVTLISKVTGLLILGVNSATLCHTEQKLGSPLGEAEKSLQCVLRPTVAFIAFVQS